MLLDTSINYGAGAADVVADILQREIHKRTLIKWKINDKRCPNSVTLTYNPSTDHAERYTIKQVGDGQYEIQAKTTRGLIYGAGRFMRSLELSYKLDYDTPFEATIRMRTDVKFPITSVPQYTWRGHQIAYRPKTHNYDAMTSEQMKQEILDQVLFGINVIEMIPPKLDDCQQSPHFLEPWTQRLTDMTAWCDQLDVKVSLWYPAFPGADWHETYKCLKRFDILFIPGGDPGGREPAEFFKIVREHIAVARQYFPNCELWVSSQFGLSVSPDLHLTPWAPKEKLESFYQQVEKNQELLTGVVYGPWTADTSKQFRERIPKKLPIRDYPDLCHNLRSQYPVGPRWDFAFAATYNRESINPRPRYYADAFHHEMPWCKHGSGCYSEGSGDDVNKMVWSALLWGETTNVDDIMEEYASWFFGDARVSKLIFALEENWRNPLRSGKVLDTLKQMIHLQADLPPHIERNWRWQMVFFRVICDAYLYQRQYGDRSNRSLAWPVEGGSSVPWRTDFEKHRKVEYFVPSEMALYGRLEASAGILFALIGMQLDVKRYNSMHEERGGHLDLLNYLPPDDNMPKGEFKVLRLHDVPTTGYEGPILDHADTTNPKVCDVIATLPTRYLTFYTCIWPGALPLEMKLDVPIGTRELEIVYVGEDLLLEGGDYEELNRCALPVRCLCNGELLHNYRHAEKTTKATRYALPKAAEHLHLVWEVEDRQKVTVRCIPVPVADVRAVSS